MNQIQTAIASVVALGGLSGGAWVGGVKAIDFLDNRYAPLQAVEDLAYSQLKKDLRELRDRIDAADGEVSGHIPRIGSVRRTSDWVQAISLGYPKPGRHGSAIQSGSSLCLHEQLYSPLSGIAP